MQARSELMLPRPAPPGTMRRLRSAATWPSRYSTGAIATLILGLAGFGQPVRAGTSAWTDSGVVHARLVSAVGGTGNLADVPAGIEVRLDGDWKTYWRAPGDAGLPPSLAWDGSENLKGATLAYPAPERFTLLNLQTFGYKHDVVFPVALATATPGRPLDLKLKLDLLVCADLCIPKQLALALLIPAGPASADPEAQLIAKADATVPTGSTASGLTITSVAAVTDHGAPALEVKASARDPFRKPDLVAEVDPPLDFGLPQVSLSADGHGATFLVPLAQPLPIGGRLAARPAVLTLIDGGRALEQRATVVAGSIAEEAGGPSFPMILGIALLGGLILNLMPCVLPVLGIKFIGVVSQGGRAPAAVRAGFLATAAGIVASFLLIAAVLIAVKAAGRTVGWGIQFQQPAFIATMAVLVTLFAGHLWGLFEVPLPRFVAAAAGRRRGPDESLLGHFATGSLATLLATPCSAPFLGTAVGFALAGNAVQMLAIFLALGLGLALPYLLIAAAPRLATRMPRPGRWMLATKKVLALPLVATAAWLVTILLAQSGVASASLVAAALVLIGALLVWRHRNPAARRALPAAIALAAVVAVVGPDLVAAGGADGGRRVDDTVAWRGFDRDRIRSLVSQGKTVFVDVTADWCLTCQANRRLVLADAAMANRLNTQTVAMRADWTRPDPLIAAFLAAYGRYGIPFNVVYGPAAPAGVVLPELLTPAAVTAALDKVASKQPNLAD